MMVAHGQVQNFELCLRGFDLVITAQAAIFIAMIDSVSRNF